MLALAITGVAVMIDSRIKWSGMAVAAVEMAVEGNVSRYMQDILFASSSVMTQLFRVLCTLFRTSPSLHEAMAHPNTYVAP